MQKQHQVRIPWLRLLAFLPLPAYLFGRDDRFAIFGLFGFFVVWGHPNKWLRYLSYVGFAGFLGVFQFL